MALFIIVVSYLIGAYSFEALFNRRVAIPRGYGDVRLVGSGNMGATNLERLLGKKFFYLCLLLDMAKGMSAVGLAWLWDGDQAMMAYCAAAAVIGHIFSCFMVWDVRDLPDPETHRWGGKGVSTLFGALLLLEWPVAVAALLVWMVLKKLTKITGLASILAALVVIVFQPVGHWPTETKFVIGMLGIFILWAHRQNWADVLAGVAKPLKSKGTVVRGAFLVHSTKPDQEALVAEFRDKVLRKTGRLGPLLNRLVDRLGTDFTCNVILPHLPLRLLRVGTWERQLSNGSRVEIDFWAIPANAERMRYMVPLQLKIARAAAKRNIVLMGLGAHNSIIGRHGEVVTDAINRLGIGVTSGNLNTVRTGVQGILKLAHQVGYLPAEEPILLIGAAGSTGKAALALLVAAGCRKIRVMFRKPEDIERLPANLRQYCEVVTMDPQAFRGVRIVLTATSSTHGLPGFDPHWLEPGTVLCDLARPRDVIDQILQSGRTDVLCIDGGIVKVGGEFNFSFGYAQGEAFACMAELIQLLTAIAYGDPRLTQGDLNFKNFSSGKDLDVSRIAYLAGWELLADQELTGWRCADKPLSPQRIADFVSRYAVTGSGTR